MSEFKYACPVCGQHMKCDASQAGSVMDCPTCFQKIVAPQAPLSADSKIILTGTKYQDKKSPAAPVHPSVAAKLAAQTAGVKTDSQPEAKPGLPKLAIIALIVVVVVGAAVFAFREKIFKSSPGSPPVTPQVVEKTVAPTPTPKPKPSAAPDAKPPVADPRWMLDLASATIPDAPVTGRIHGQDFSCDRAAFQVGALILRMGAGNPPDFAAMIHFNGVQPAALAGKTIHIAPAGETSAKLPLVTLRWKDGGAAQKNSFPDGYAMRLEFGALADTHLPGKIYLCLPDPEKSFLLGTFDAAIQKPAAAAGAAAKPKGKGKGQPKK